MAVEKFTLDEYAVMMGNNKPYLIALEGLVGETDYGQVEVILDVRAKEVEKMTVVNRKVWLRPKAGHERKGFVTVSEAVAMNIG